MRLCLLLVVFCLLLPGNPAQASSGHYAAGSAGIKAGSLPPPGHYAGVLSLYYSADTIKNRYGKTMDVDYSMDLWMVAPYYSYSSEQRILGARYAFNILVPVVHTDFSVGKTFGLELPNHLGVFNIRLSKSDTETGLSDVFITPVQLTWEREWFDITTGLGVFIPTGNYSATNPASPGKGFWTISPSLGGTLYLDKEKTWSISALAHYEFHTKQRDTDRTPGNHLFVEWGVGKTFLQIFKAGIVGYHTRQVTHDSGEGSRKNLLRANAIGAEAGVYIPGVNLDVTMRFYKEYDNYSNAQGTTSVLNVAFPF